MAKKSTNPTCPHCDYQFDQDETWHSQHNGKTGEVLTDDGDVSELTCPNKGCNKPFFVRCAHDIHFVACDEEGDNL